MQGIDKIKGIVGYAWRRRTSRSILGMLWLLVPFITCFIPLLFLFSARDSNEDFEVIYFVYLTWSLFMLAFNSARLNIRKLRGPLRFLLMSPLYIIFATLVETVIYLCFFLIVGYFLEVVPLVLLHLGLTGTLSGILGSLFGFILGYIGLAVQDIRFFVDSSLFILNITLLSFVFVYQGFSFETIEIVSIFTCIFFGASLSIIYAIRFRLVTALDFCLTYER